MEKRKIVVFHGKKYNRKKSSFPMEIVKSKKIIIEFLFKKEHTHKTPYFHVKIHKNPTKKVQNEKKNGPATLSY